jgi:hypothetical protein
MQHRQVEASLSMSSVARTGFLAAVCTALLAVVTLSIGVLTPPRAGPFAMPGTSLAYPYADAAPFVPRDFLWMYPGLLMMLAFLVLAACVREHAAPERRLFGTIGVCLATVAFVVIGADYFIQLQTVQPALLRGEGAALAVISQYNPHGVFIALENFGFLTMSLSFAFLTPCLGHSRRERATRWVFLVASALAALALVGMSLYYGFELEYRFEVAVISINWLTLIACGILLAGVFQRSYNACPRGKVIST